MAKGLMLGAALLTCFFGMAWFALAMRVHWHQVKGGERPLARGVRSILRSMGALALVGSLGLCLSADHASMAALVWVMALAGSALLVALTLAWRPRWLAWLVVIWGLACNDDDTVVLQRPLGPDTESPMTPDPIAPDTLPPSVETPEPTTAGPVYAFQYLVYTNDDVASYVVLTDTLDITELPSERAIEFPGYAFIAASNGQLLVSDGESPIITRYEIDADLAWHERGRLSFANFGVAAGGAGFERHWFLDEHTAYLTLQVTQRVVWDPLEFTIRSVVDDSSLEANRDGFVLDAAFNRQPRALKGPVLKPFYYRDEDWFRFGPVTPIAVYDRETHAESSIVEVPCPGLEVATQDEAGNTYFSGWTYGPTLSLFGAGPAPCVRRIRPDSTLDAEWTPDLTAWTGGRPVHVFRYMKDGMALGTVLHQDESGVDFTRGYSEEAALALDAHWHLWSFDLENETAQQISGLGPTGAGFNWARFDDRTFVVLPNEDWSQTKVFEVDSSGTATERFESVGWVSEWLRVR